MTVLLIGAPARAAAAYGQWAVSGSGTSWRGTLDVPVAGFPHANLTTNSLSPTIGAGVNTYLGAQTPIGAAFGSSQGRQYLTFRATAGNAPSTTTLTFDTPTPAGSWAFALGDIDADRITIRATDATGAPLPASALGFRSGFNYCVNTPQPPACTGPGPFTDTPTWNPATATLTGNLNDTLGSAAWFRPTVPLRSITFVFAELSGNPIAQLWVAATDPPQMPTQSPSPQVVAVPVAGVIPAAAPAAPSLPVTGSGYVIPAAALLTLGALLLVSTRRRR